MNAVQMQFKHLALADMYMPDLRLARNVVLDSRFQGENGAEILERGQIEIQQVLFALLGFARSEDSQINDWFLRIQQHFYRALLQPGVRVVLFPYLGIDDSRRLLPVEAVVARRLEREFSEQHIYPVLITPQPHAAYTDALTLFLMTYALYEPLLARFGPTAVQDALKKDLLMVTVILQIVRAKLSLKKMHQPIPCLYAHAPRVMFEFEGDLKSSTTERQRVAIHAGVASVFDRVAQKLAQPGGGDLPRADFLKAFTSHMLAGNGHITVGQRSAADQDAPQLIAHCFDDGISMHIHLNLRDAWTLEQMSSLSSLSWFYLFFLFASGINRLDLPLSVLHEQKLGSGPDLELQAWRLWDDDPSHGLRGPLKQFVGTLMRQGAKTGDES